VDKGGEVNCRGLPYDNQKFKLWCNRVETIIKKGLDADDYERLDFVQSKYFLDDIVDIGIEQSEDYPKKLKDYETALKSIIEKYEILGFEGEWDKGGEAEMNETEKQEIIDELKNFYKKLRSYQNRQRRRLKEDASESKDRSLNALRLELQRTHGRLGDIISKYGGIRVLTYLGREYEVFSLALSSLNMRHNEFTALDGAIGLVNKTIGKLESTPLADTELQEASVTQEPKDTADLPVYLFDAMQFHPRVIQVSESLFKTGNYASAILEAFKAVDNYVKEKTALSLNGQALMSKVFDENAPIIKLNDLLTQSDRDEQEGFKLLFKGATVGIRNPKAHDNVVQTDPHRTLEYLGLASLLMRRIEEGKLVKLLK
jgi:uncharacterized protein (TIGR02391 family)